MLAHPSYLSNGSIYYLIVLLYPRLAGAVTNHGSPAALTRSRIMSINLLLLTSPIQSIQHRPQMTALIYFNWQLKKFFWWLLNIVTRTPSLKNCFWVSLLTPWSSSKWFQATPKSMAEVTGVQVGFRHPCPCPCNTVARRIVITSILFFFLAL